MNRQGLVNHVFVIEADRIDVATVSSSRSDLNSTGSQSFLTSSQTNYRYTQPENEEEVRVPTPSNMVRRWSQNLSKLGKGKKTIREKTIYRLPSRKLFAVDGQLLTSNDMELEQLASEIEQHDQLMQASPTGKQLRMDTIRALPHPLTTKRRLKEKLSISVNQNSSSETSGYTKRAKDFVTHSCGRVMSLGRCATNSIEIWYDSMKEIEGHFGSSVGTYFKFLRWLFVLNVILLVFTFSFITLPQILYNDYGMNNASLGIRVGSDDFQFLDLMTGDGYFKHSVLFYGAYTNMTFSLGPSRHSYSLPHAYFMTMLCLYMCTFVVISTSMARSYRKSFIETSGGIRSMYAHKIFCSWDFGISNRKAAELKHKTIFHELKGVLSELDESKDDMPRLWRLWIVVSQLTAHLLVGGMIAGLGTALWILMKYFSKNDQSEMSSWDSLYLPMAVNLSIVMFQAFFSWVAKMEDYRSPRRSLHITLVRNFALEAVIIGVLIVFWLNKPHSECWETSIGQEIYRLIIADFIVNVMLMPIMQLVQVFVILHYWPTMDKPSFDISQNSLGLVFNQTLIWVGLLFSPLLSVLVAIKMILLFYIKKLTLIYLCKSPSQIWRSAQTQTLYLVFTFLSLLGVIVTLGYIMTQVPVSQRCGPFRGYDFMFQIFIDGVLKLRENHWIWRAIMTIARPAVMGGILLTMMVVVYYLRSKSKARGVMVKLLKDMLYLEAKDKEFLLMNITKAAQDRESLCGDNDDESESEDDRDAAAAADRYAESCSTWRYEGRGRRAADNNQDDCMLRSRHV